MGGCTIPLMYDDTCKFLSESPAEMLRQAAQLVEQIEEPTAQANLMAASAILLVRRDIMQESVIYRSIQDEKTRAIALNFLREGLSAEAVARGTGLSIEEVQQLQQQMNAVPQS
jgi:CRP-like cAMP-binding protein